MRKIALILLASCFTLFVNSQTKTKTKTHSGTKEVTVKYRVVVSFVSIGSGIDGNRFDAITNFVNKHAKKPAYDIIQKGREGERDYCFHLKEMNKDEQKAFIDELRKMAQGSDIIHINENTERVKKQ